MGGPLQSGNLACQLTFSQSSPRKLQVRLERVRGSTAGREGAGLAAADKKQEEGLGGAAVITGHLLLIR